MEDTLIKNDLLDDFTIEELIEYSNILSDYMDLIYDD